jgi:hypothetical protein
MPEELEDCELEISPLAQREVRERPLDLLDGDRLAGKLILGRAGGISNGGRRRG